MAKILTIADVDSIKILLNCNIANKLVENDMNLSYGIECVDNLEEEIDKSSAYLWALNSSCTLSNTLSCDIVNFANKIQFRIDSCNPDIPCVSSRSQECNINILDNSNISLCYLPPNGIEIIL